MKLSVDPNNEKAYVSLRGLKKASRRGIRQGNYFLGRDLMKTSKDGMKKGPKSGKTYTITKNGRRQNHTASAPGEYPANLTGETSRGIRFEVRGSRQLVFGAQSEWAPYLERGTSRMAPRPFLYKSIRANERNALKHYSREIERAHYNEIR